MEIPFTSISVTQEGDTEHDSDFYFELYELMKRNDVLQVSAALKYSFERED